MQYDLLLTNCLIPSGDFQQPAEIAASSGKIAAILQRDSGAEAMRI
jgi:predicted amidohydrolase